MSRKVIVKRKEAPNKACTRLVGVAAFSSSLRGLEFVPAKWRYPVPPTKPLTRAVGRWRHTALKI